MLSNGGMEANVSPYRPRKFRTKLFILYKQAK